MLQHAIDSRYAAAADTRSLIRIHQTEEERKRNFEMGDFSMPIQCPQEDHYSHCNYRAVAWAWVGGCVLIENHLHMSGVNLSGLTPMLMIPSEACR